MINNRYIHDADNYKSAADNAYKLFKEGLINYTDYIIIESSIRNQCIILTLSDLGEKLSENDLEISYNIRQAIKTHQ